MLNIILQSPQMEYIVPKYSPKIEDSISFRATRNTRSVV